MRLLQLSVPANDGLDIAAQGDYVRVRSSAVDLIIENPDNGEKIEVSQGDDFEFSPFKRLRISHSSGTPQDIKLIISQGKKAGSAQVGGSVSLAGAVALDAATLAALETINVTSVSYPVMGTGINVQKTVTNTSTSLIAQNTGRKYLLIQNKDTTGNIYICFGAAATISNGLKIGPNQTFIMESNVLTNAINAIGDIASNANIVVIEG